MCGIESIFLLQRRKEACHANRGISTTSRRGLSSSFFSARKLAEGNSRYSDRIIWGNMHHFMPPSKTG